MRRGRVLVGAVGAAALCLVVASCGLGVTGEASDVTDVGAVLTGKVRNTVAEPTDYWFEYGTTPTYGSTTPRSTVSVSSPQAAPSVSAQVGGLDEGATYHFRLCTAGTDHAGICGEDATFATTSGRDSVSGRGTVIDLGFGYVIGASVFATSGPGGVAPVEGDATVAPGSVYFKVADAGPVTCLRVVGNRAAIGLLADAIDLGQPDPHPIPEMIFIEDNGPTGDRFGRASLSEAAATCPVPTEADFPDFTLGDTQIPPVVGSGDFTVHDH